MSQLASIRLPQTTSDINRTSATAGNRADTGALETGNGQQPESFSDSLQRAQSTQNTTGHDAPEHSQDGKALPDASAESGKDMQGDQHAESTTAEHNDASLPASQQPELSLPELTDNQASLSIPENVSPEAGNSASSAAVTSVMAQQVTTIAGDGERAAAQSSLMMSASRMLQQASGLNTDKTGAASEAPDALLAERSAVLTQAAQAGSTSLKPAPVAVSGSAQETDGLFKTAMQTLTESATPASASATTMTSLSAQTASSTAVLQSALNTGSVLASDPVLPGSTLIPGPVSQAGSLSSPAGALPMQASVSVPFGQTEWGNAFSKQVMMLVNQNVRSAEIRMNPANLGPIEIQIDMNEDQVNVAFSSRHAAVREAMELAMPKLREMLESNGLDLAQSNVSDQSFARQHDADFSDAHQRDNSSVASIGSDAGHDTDHEPALSNHIAGMRATAMLDVYI